MFVTQLSRIISKTSRRPSTASSNITTSRMSSSASSSYATSPNETLVSLAIALQTSAERAVDAVKQFIGAFPQARQDLADLETRLERVGKSARVLAQSSSGERDLGEDLVGVLRRVVGNARALVDDDVWDVVRSETGKQKSRAWSEHIVERVLPVARIVESVGLTMALAVSVLEFTEASGPSDSTADLPPYDHSQILHEGSALRTRLMEDLETDDHRVLGQLPTLVEFVQAVDEYMEQSSSSFLNPQLPLRDSVGERSSGAVSSLHSEAAQVPDYNAIGITNPAPLSINVRHHVKKEIPNFEVFQIVFLTRNRQPAIAVATLDVSTRFYDINVNQVACLSHQHGVNMTFSPDGRKWAYLCESDSKDLNPLSHDGVHFRKPVVTLGDFMNGSKVQQMKWPGVKPLSFSPDGKWLAVGSSKGRMALLDIKMGAVLSKAIVIPSHTADITHAVFTPDSALLVSQSRDGTIRLTDPVTRTSIAKLETDTWKEPSFLGVLPNNEVIVSIWGDVVFHWNYHSGNLETYSISTRRTREGWPIAISQDCRFLCCRTDDGVDLSDLHSGKVLYTIKFQRGYATTAAFSVDGKYLVLGKATSSIGVRVTVSTLDVWELIF